MTHNFIKSNDEEVRCTCPRCGGTGYLPQYRHIENGICFKCRRAKQWYTINTECLNK